MTYRRRYSIQSDCLKLESGRQGLEMGCDWRLNPVHFITWSLWASPPPGPIDESRNRRAKILFLAPSIHFDTDKSRANCCKLNSYNSAETKKSLHSHHLWILPVSPFVYLWICGQWLEVSWTRVVRAYHNHRYHFSTNLVNNEVKRLASFI
jgi:hypothetical protein